MPGTKPLVQPVETIYLYDGSLAGFYCCVYESVYRHELPYAIEPEAEAQPRLLPQKYIPTAPERARRVRQSIPRRISTRAEDLLETVFLSCMPQKELAMLRFLLLGYGQGAQTLAMLGHPDVAPLLEAEKHLGGEAHLLRGFVRFADYDGVLIATITPKNFVLPFIASHFTSRFSQERFMIYDKTHRAALIYENGKRQIVHLEQVDFPQVTETERHYRALWKRFYDTIAIEARHNPKCRMTHMPKRYWENMIEMQDQY